jgi:SAM-dependent methyltransferase
MQFKGNNDQSSARYWDDLAGLYQKETRISTNDFHYGPLLPGDSSLGLLPPVPQRSCFQCLEIGCGAGQNSIFLAKQGAQCIATDISEQQLAHGRKLAHDEKVEVDFRCISMDSLDQLQNPPRPSRCSGHPSRGGEFIKSPPPEGCPQGGVGLFDLIHSTYALPFSANPQKVIADAAAMLKPGGIFLLTTGHPLYAGEWLDIGDDEQGLFLPDYFRPEPDVRMSLDDKTMSAAQTWPVSTITEWIHSAGLVIDRLLEPAPMPIPDLSEAEICARVPYESKGWRELYPQLARIPVVLIFKCIAG